jgi:rhodanese-related sulfurtransferase
MEATLISAEDLKHRLDRHEPLFFIDTRNPKAWESSPLKMPGAMRIAADEIEQHLTRIPRDRTVISYCT